MHHITGKIALVEAQLDATAESHLPWWQGATMTFGLRVSASHSLAVYCCYSIRTLRRGDSLLTFRH